MKKKKEVEQKKQNTEVTQPNVFINFSCFGCQYSTTARVCI
jgi:hypothetical protein